MPDINYCDSRSDEEIKNDFKRVVVTITATSASQMTIKMIPPMPESKQTEEWRDKLNLAIAQACPFTLLQNYKDADFKIIIDCVDSLLTHQKKIIREDLEKLQVPMDDEGNYQADPVHNQLIDHILSLPSLTIKEDE